MKKKGFIILSLFIIILLFLSSCSNRPYDGMIDAYGLLSNSAAPIAWQETNAEFIIKDFTITDKNYANLKYTLRNTSSNEVDAEFLLPYSIQNNTSDYYTLDVNDNVIKSEYRHAYFGSDPLDIRVFNQPISDLTYNLDTKVFKYTFKCSSENEDNFVGINLKLNDLAISSDNFSYSVHKDTSTFAYRIGNSNEKNLYFLNVDPDFSKSDIIFYSNGSLSKRITGDVIQFTKEEIKLKELMDISYDEEDKIAEIDYQNIYLKILQNSESKYLYLSNDKIKNYIINVIKYTISFEPNQVLNVETKIPLYPHNLHGYRSDLYQYKVILSPMSEKLNILVKTNYYITHISTGIYSNTSEHSYELSLNDNYVFDFNVSSAQHGLTSTEVHSLIFAIVISLFFYLIPILVMLLLFIMIKNKKGKFIIYSQKIITYTITFFSFLFLQNSFLKYLILALFITSLLLTCIEFFVKKDRYLNRLIVQVLTAVISIFVYLFSTPLVFSICFGILNLIIFIIVICNISKMKKTLNNSQY